MAFEGPLMRKKKNKEEFKKSKIEKIIIFQLDYTVSIFDFDFNCDIHYTF